MSDATIFYFVLLLLPMSLLTLQPVHDLPLVVLHVCHDCNFVRSVSALPHPCLELDLTNHDSTQLLGSLPMVHRQPHLLGCGADPGEAQCSPQKRADVDP